MDKANGERLQDDPTMWSLTDEEVLALLEARRILGRGMWEGAWTQGRRDAWTSLSLYLEKIEPLFRTRAISLRK